MRQRIYIDNSVIGGYFDEEFEGATKLLFISWNFKHIVNFNKIKQFNSINLKLGYPLIDIRTPLEFLNYEN